MPTLGVFAQGSPAKLFVPIKNGTAASFTNGFAVGLACVGNSVTGVDAVLMASGTAGNLPGFLGVANGDIASGSFGLAQCWGLAASVYLSQYGTSVTVTLGDALVPGAEAGGLGSTVPTYLNAGFKYAIVVSAPAALSLAKPSNYTTAILRCL